MAPGSIDPFDPKNLIFQPVLQVIPSDWKNVLFKFIKRLKLLI